MSSCCKRPKIVYFIDEKPIELTKSTRQIQLMRLPRKNIKIRFFRSRITKWYKLNRRAFPWRKRSLTAYEVVISEILLQRTKAEAVKRYYNQFLLRYPSWSALTKANNKSLRKFLEPIGLWRQRADVLQSLSRAVKQSGGRLPSEREKLEQLPGVGQYIASAVLAIHHGNREPLLDVNMARLLERYFGPRKLADIRYDPYLQTLARQVLPRKSAKEFNWAILDFASMVCTRKNPKHELCPLRPFCSYQI